MSDKGTTDYGIYFLRINLITQYSNRYNMKKLERNELAEKLILGVNELLQNSQIVFTKKIEKAVKKSAKRISKNAKMKKQNH